MAEETAIPNVPAGEIPVPVAEQLVKLIEKLHERIDRDRDEHSLLTLQTILAQHGEALKQFIQPENRLHPDVSWYNPEGELEHPRPKLKRPCYFLGSHLEPPTLSVTEINLLNRFDRTVEIKARKWKAAILRDMAGGEVLYISVPFKGFDDVRGLPGLATDPNDPQQRMGILETLLGDGKRPESQDLMFEQIQLQKAEIEELKNALAQLVAAQQASAPVAHP